jgi:hypothetical protein
VAQTPRYWRTQEAIVFAATVRSVDDVKANQGGDYGEEDGACFDMSGEEIADGKGATIRIAFRDARKGVRELDVTDAEAEALGGRQVARRGRRPRAAAAAS